MNINLPYNLPRPEDKNAKVRSNPENTLEFIEAAANSVFEKGFDTGSQRRTFGRLQRKIDAAIEKEEDEIELAADEKDLLKEIFFKRNPQFFPNWSKYVVILEEEIERAIE